MPSSYVIFCDESGQRDYGPGTDDYFVVAGVVVDALEASHLENELRGLKRAFWGKPDIEIKSNWLRQPAERQKRYTEPHGIGLPEIEKLMSAVYAWLANTPIVFLAGVVDKPLMKKNYGDNAHYAGGVAYDIILQRFQKFSLKRQAVGNVIFDDPAGKSPGGFEWQELLQKQHAKLKKHGCPYSGAAFPNIGTLTFADSKGSQFIQLADLVAYNTFRQFRTHGKEWEHPKSSEWPMYKYFAEMSSLFDKSPQGVVAGYGIAKWPVENKIQWSVS